MVVDSKLTEDFESLEDLSGKMLESSGSVDKFLVEGKVLQLLEMNSQYDSLQKACDSFT